MPSHLIKYSKQYMKFIFVICMLRKAAHNHISLKVCKPTYFQCHPLLEVERNISFLTVSTIVSVDKNFTKKKMGNCYFP